MNGPAFIVLQCAACLWGRKVHLDATQITTVENRSAMPCVRKLCTVEGEQQREIEEAEENFSVLPWHSR